MFQEKAVLFMYCVSPVHAGAGTALGAIDSPIQRERHTYHPTIAGSGIKGAMREHCEGLANSEHDKKKLSSEHEKLSWVFGPKPDDSNDHAGAVSFSDAQIVLFPVRSTERSFVYATCPTALARLHRLLHLAGLLEQGKDNWSISEPPGQTYVSLGSLPGDLILESFEFKCSHMEAKTDDIAKFISTHALPAAVPAYAFFREKMSKDLILLSDSDFTHFVRHSTLVEPHVQINDASGTAQDQGLFYVENLPPESVLVSLIMASPQRSANSERMKAQDVIAYITDKLNGYLVQLGGDSTTGRGHVLLALARSPAKKGESNDQNAHS